MMELFVYVMMRSSCKNGTCDDDRIIPLSHMHVLMFLYCIYQCRSQACYNSLMSVALFNIFTPAKGYCYQILSLYPAIFFIGIFSRKI